MSVDEDVYGMLVWCSSSGNLELFLDWEDAQCCAQPGDNEPAINELKELEYVQAQIRKLLKPEAFNLVVEELLEYGAWTSEELKADPDMTMSRLLWCACWDVTENPEDAVLSEIGLEAVKKLLEEDVSDLNETLKLQTV